MSVPYVQLLVCLSEFNPINLHFVANLTKDISSLS